ncbi:MAG: helix-hairpin-helix domain-containing protein [Balneolaceae bacterium]|nr:helix-hairpin-helix domain-containing protein [Balneolaceae bacterium]
MSKLSRYLPLLILICWFISAPAADARQLVEDDIETIMNNLFQGEELSDEELQLLTDSYMDLILSPVNINRAGETELLTLPGITPGVARNIVRHRNRNGPYRHISDLLEINGIEEEFLVRNHLFITTGSRQERFREHYLTRSYWAEGARTEHVSRVQSVMETQEGYQKPEEEGGFLGNPLQIYQRTRFTGRRLSLNMNSSKLPGEEPLSPISSHHQSWHAALRNTGSIQTAIAGDFHVQFGRGLLLNTAGQFGKNPQTSSMLNRQDRGILPATASRSGATFRGLGFTAGNRVQLSLFHSSRNRTATIHDDGSASFPVSFPAFRTQNELSRKGSLNEKSFGARVRFSLPGGYLGFSSLHTEYDLPITSGNRPDQIYNFSGFSQTGYSTDFLFNVAGLLIFGESAITDNGGSGYIAGISASAGPQTDLTLSVRSFSPDFRAIHGNPFSELSGAPGNERGFFGGIRFRPENRITLTAFADHFTFPAARFRNTRPTSGFEYRFVADISMNRNLHLQLQFRQKQREQELEFTNHLGRAERRMSSENRRSMRLQAEFRPQPTLRFRTRIEQVDSRSADNIKEQGLLLFQDLQIHITRTLRIDGRVTLFDTDGYNARVFQFENDFLYRMTNTMLQNRGQRIYAMFTASLSSSVTAWARYSITTYDDQILIGSGNQTIAGNRRSDLSFQVRVVL